MLTGTVKAGIPLVELGSGNTVSLGEVTTPAVLGSDSGVTGTAGDNMSNSVGRSTLGGRAPVISRLRLSDSGRSTLGSGLLGSGLLGGLLGSMLLGGLLADLLGSLLGSMLLGDLLGGMLLGSMLLGSMLLGGMLLGGLLGSSNLFFS